MSDWGGLGNSPFAERADLEAAPYQYMGGKVPKERKNRRKTAFFFFVDNHFYNIQMAIEREIRIITLRGQSRAFG